MSYQRLQNHEDEYELDIRKAAKNRKYSRSTNNHGQNEGSNGSHSNELYPEKVDFIYHDVGSEDTLQGISLRYACTVDKLRYYNHFMSDLEFRALKVIKIPVTQYSVRLGQLIDIDQPSGSDHRSQQHGQNRTIDETPKIINIGISNYLNQSAQDGNDYKQFLDNLGNDINKYREQQLKKQNMILSNDTPGTSDPSNDKIIHLGHPSHDDDGHQDDGADKLLTSHGRTRRRTNFGMDLGINWFYLWLAILLLFLPIVYGTYIFIHLDHYTHPSTDTYHSRAIKYVHNVVKNLYSSPPQIIAGGSNKTASNLTSPEIGITSLHDLATPSPDFVTSQPELSKNAPEIATS